MRPFLQSALLLLLATTLAPAQEALPHYVSHPVAAPKKPAYPNRAGS